LSVCVGCVVAQRNAPKVLDGALAYGVTHPTGVARLK
jgi:hypothetical protein